MCGLKCGYKFSFLAFDPNFCKGMNFGKIMSTTPFVNVCLSKVFILLACHIVTTVFRKPNQIMQFVVRIALSLRNSHTTGLGKGGWYFTTQEESLDNLTLNDFCFFLKTTIFPPTVHLITDGDHFTFMVFCKPTCPIQPVFYQTQSSKLAWLNISPTTCERINWFCG